MGVTILIADDDPVQRRLLENMVERLGYHAMSVESGDAAVAALTAADAAPIDCVILDLVMPGLDGMGVLDKLREANIAAPVIVQTAHGGIDNVVQAIRAGAQDFVVKPVGIERLQVSLRNALDVGALKNELQRLRHAREGRLGFRDVIAHSAAMQATLQTARKAAGSSIPVLIEGEPGVGKEVVARAIHGSGERSGKPFVVVNCVASSGNLVEAALAKFVEASGGTLFLDEVSELQLAAQLKLLRVLQEGSVEVSGGRRPVKVDVRIISATSRRLLERVKEGHFREDLYYRLHVLPMTVPPLRSRREDIPHLVRHFVARFSAEEKRSIARVNAEAMAMLTGADWPGNIRQLQNAIYRAVVMSNGDELCVEDFPPVPMVAPPLAADALEMMPLGTPQVAASEAPMAPLSPVGSLSMLSPQGDMRPLAEIEAEAIAFAITHYRGQMSEVARRLRIGRSTLYRKIEEAPEMESSCESQDARLAAL